MQLSPKISSNSRLRITVFIITLVLVAVSFLYTVNLRNSADDMKGTPISVDGTVNAIGFSGDGALTYLGIRENKVIALDENNQVVWEFETMGPVLDLETNNGYIYVSDDERYIHILDNSGNVISSIKVGYRPITVAGSGDGQRILTGTTMTAMKNRLQLYDINGEQLFNQAPRNVITDVYLLDDNKHGIYISRNAEVLLFDEQGEEINSNKIAYYPVDSCFSSDSNILVVSDEGNNIYAFNTKLKLLWNVNLNEKINSIGIDPVNQQVVAVSNEGRLIVLDDTGNEQFRITVPKEIRSIEVNQSNGSLITLKGNNEVFRYGGEILSSFARNQTLLSIFNIVNIVLVVALIITAINLMPKVSHAIATRLINAAKVLYKHKLSYILILPTIALLLVFNYYPAISGLFIAFTDYKPGIYMRWVGLDNFIAMVENPYFWTGVKNMLIFLVTDLLKALIPPILFAELIVALKSSKAQYWTRVALYLPGILPGVAGLLVWKEGILGQRGLINSTLELIGLGQYATPWLGNEKTAIWALVFIGFPFIGSYIIFYGALIGIPSSLFDAAKIDGCGWWRRMLFIDIPLISPQIKYVFVVSFIASVQNFGLVYLTTMGGPGHSTYTPILELYYNMTKFQQYGVAAAMGLFLFIVIFGATLMNLRIQTAQDKM
ncbi:MAG: PQQ-binding-like beta-propeller repeat protein [Clostridiales bacterium]|nr:PQQ-binding-like beta-propeller repeat protein [Clostridiales bacterium]